MKKRMSSLLLAIMMIVSLLVFAACQGGGNTVKVMVEQGEHFQVIGESVKEVKMGDDVSFEIRIDEGYYYVFNNCGAQFDNNTLVLRNVKTPKTIKLEIKANVYIVKLNETEGLKVRDGDNYAQKSLSLETNHGETAVFDIQIDEAYEYYQNVVNSADNNHQQAVYEDGKLYLSNVCSNKEVFVQLRKTAVEEGKPVLITLEENEAFTIQGANVQEVESGSDVVFNITVKEGYYYVSNNCGAEYDAAEGKIIFKHARANQKIRLVFKKMNTETTYYVNGIVETSANGENILYSATPNTDYVFNGWYYMEKSEKVFYSYINHLEVSGYEMENLSLKPYFVSKQEHQVITYHANGGKIYGSADDTITYAFNHDVYLYPATFGEWCFKTFYRDGYAPIEYNTKPDGSGEAISLGSRIFTDEKAVELYLIWAKENDESAFTYTYVEEGNSQSGIKLTQYTGADVSVTIPTQIDGIPVKVIGARCFESRNIQSVVITKNITTIENGAFSNCSSLETVYMCDSVEVVSNDSFAQCTALKNLRMIAVLPPVYADHLIGATIRRFELLFHTRGDSITNIMFYGGSSTFQGIDGATLTKNFNADKYRIINCAQNAYVSGSFMMELYSHFMKKGDIMTFMPEYSPQAYSTRWELPSWIAIEAFYDAFRYIDLRDYSNVFDAFYDLQHGTKDYVYVGKLQQIEEGQGFSYDTYDNTFDQYFTRAENFEIEKARLDPKEDLVDLDTLMDLALCDINTLYDRRYKGNLTMYFAYHGFWENAYEKTQHATYEQWLKENLHFPYISNYQNHMLDIEYMSDSISHLTREGAILHSLVLAEELKKQMPLDGYLL